MSISLPPTDSPPPRHTVPLSSRLGWNSLRGRYAYTAAGITTALAATAWLSHAPWAVVVAAIGAMIAGGIWLERRAVRPLRDITRALDTSSARAWERPRTHAAVREIDELMAAFAHTCHGIDSRRQRLEAIVDNIAEGIVTFDADGIIVQVNRATERLFGYAEPEIVGKDIDLLIHPLVGEKRTDEARHFMRDNIQRLIGREGEVTGRHKDGATFVCALKVSKIALDGREVYIGLMADVSERNAMVNHLKAMAEHDGLTGLYNRTYFQQELERVVERARRTKNLTCAVLYIDLDNFKYVNDTLGHAAGDRLLIEVAGILHKRARKSDLIARFGGDEFTVLLYDITPDLAVLAAESFRKKLANYRFRHEGEQVEIGCSIGVAAVAPQSASAEEALSQADLACHLAKRNGRNQVHVFRPTDVDDAATMSLDRGWSRRIKHAIEHDGFSLACQPIVNARSRDIEAYEVLIRMVDETNKLILPAGFLSSAERFGLSVDIDKWVIVNAIDILKRERRTLPGLRYSINLSGPTLAHPDVCDLIERKLADTGLDADALAFEVTETTAIADMATAQTFLTRLRRLGCGTALDHFGSGMSSFAYLKDLPVDGVKIDGRFVRNLAANPVDQAMVKAMNDIVHALGKHTVAGLVEDEASFRLLVEYGVDYAQGYHLGRPDAAGSHAAGVQPRARALRSL